MKQSTFRLEASNIKENINPYKLVRLDEIRQMESGAYNVDNVDFLMSPNAQRTLDKAIGTTQKQLNVVKGCSGEVGQANFHNYLSVATNISQEKQVVLVADRENKIVTDVIVLKDDFIPVEAFFDFSELFVDYTHAEVEKIERSLHGDMDVRIYFRPSDPEVMSLEKGEDFITNGMYLHWNGFSIEFGNYFIRLVCMNGQTEKIERKESVIFSMKVDSIGKLLELASSKDVLNSGFMLFKEKALEAMSSVVSLRELRRTYELLKCPTIGLPQQIAADIVPYDDYTNHFNNRGIDVTGREKIVKTDLTWWQLYNKLTNFATHTTYLAEDDILRQRIINMAMGFLCNKHDISTYIDYE